MLAGFSWSWAAPFRLRRKVEAVLFVSRSAARPYWLGRCGGQRGLASWPGREARAAVPRILARVGSQEPPAGAPGMAGLRAGHGGWLRKKAGVAGRGLPPEYYLASNTIWVPLNQYQWLSSQAVIAWSPAFGGLFIVFTYLTDWFFDGSFPGEARQDKIPRFGAHPGPPWILGAGSWPARDGTKSCR